MGFFDFLQSKPKNEMSVQVNIPKFFETTSLSVKVQVLLSSPSPVEISGISVQLRASLTNPKKFPGATPSAILGEVILADKPIALTPEKPETVDLEIPVDLSAIDNLDIPPENLAAASPEMRAAIMANRTGNYSYFVEAVIKVTGQNDITSSRSIQLVQPDQVHYG